MDRRAMLTALGAGLAAPGLQAADHGGSNHGTSPLNGQHAHFCGIHIAKNNPKFQIVAQHYCAAHSDDLFQCVLFDSSGKNAKLLGIEYIVSDKQYRRLPEAEKKYWHPHTYEVLGGGLIAPGMDPDKEMAFMKTILTTWGKTWHTWPDPQTAVPLGEPLLIWSLTGDGQVDEKVLAARDKQFNVAAEQIRAKRCQEIGYEVPQVSLPKSMDQVGRQWTDSGEDRPRRKR